MIICTQADSFASSVDGRAHSPRSAYAFCGRCCNMEELTRVDAVFLTKGAKTGELRCSANMLKMQLPGLV